MINEQIMVDTVSRMLEAGIDETTIVSTLVDTGLTQEDALALVGRVKSPKSSPEQQSQSFSQRPQDSQDIQLMKNQFDVQSQTQEMNDASVHNKLDMHEQKIDDVAKTLDEVKQGLVSQVSSDPVASQRLSALELKLEEVSAVSKANLDLMKSILETNRKILTNLEAKK
ncbi:MAG: hypothetical protein WCW13_03785 [archaeon]|jgi:hypothetical protein